MLGLVVGKAIGVSGGTWLVARFTRAELDEGLAWSDIVGVAILSGLGFTVSLLIGELAYGSGTARDDTVKVGVLLGSLLAAGLAALVLRRRNAHYRALEAADGNGPPSGRIEPVSYTHLDVYKRQPRARRHRRTVRPVPKRHPRQRGGRSTDHVARLAVHELLTKP